MAWNDFFVAQTGASAALAGLVFVGVSINLPKIIGSRRLTDRAFEAAFLMFVVLATSVAALVPSQSGVRLGVEFTCAGVIGWGLLTRLHFRGLRTVERQFRAAALLSFGLAQAATVPLVIGGAIVASGSVGGLDLVALAIVAGYAAAFADAWILLIEINR